MSKRKAVLDLFEEMGLERVDGRNRNIVLPCPFAPYSDRHKSEVDKRPSFAVLPHEDRPCDIQCFTCGFKASAHNGGVKFMVAALAEHDPARWQEHVDAAEDVEYPVGDSLILPLQGRHYLDRLEQHKKLSFEDAEYKLFDQKFHRYLSDRGIEPATGAVWEAAWDSHRRRVVFPVRQQDGTLVGAVGRAVDPDASVKYLHYWDMQRSNVLFGEQLITAGNTLIVVEGVLDAVFAWQVLKQHEMLGAYNVVATLGHAVTEKQLSRIVCYAKEVVVFMDNDEPGLLSTVRVARRLYRKVKTYAVAYEDCKAKDPGGMEPAQFVRLVKRARLFVP
jgi:5S rRNA maturation endonuclease (ribonuclease M5)